MSNLTQFFGAAASSLANDPLSQPLMFQYLPGYWGHAPIKQFYDHALRPIARKAPQHAINNSAPYWSSDAASGNDQADSATGTAQTQVYGINCGTGANTYLGHSFYAGSINDNQGGMVGKVSYEKRNRAAVAAKSCGVTVGLQQDYALITGSAISGAGDRSEAAMAGFYITPRSIPEAIKVHFEVGGPRYGNRASATGKGGVRLQAAGVLTTNYKLANGGVCYNQRTKKLVILERVTGNSNYLAWRPVLIHNAPDPGEYINRSDDYQTALTAITSTSSNRVVGPVSTVGGSSNEAEMRHWCRPILSDDNSVTFFGGATQNVAGCPLVKWSWNSSTGAFNAATAVSTATTRAQWSGGHASDFDSINCAGGTNFQISLDGKTVCLFQNSHAYSAGLQYALVNTETGGLSKIVNNHSTTDGFQCIPYGASNFGFFPHTNTNNVGVIVTSINWKDYDAESGGAGTYAGELAAPASWRVSLLDGAHDIEGFPLFVMCDTVDNKAIVNAEIGKWNK
jgi:hypothetical protein